MASPRAIAIKTANAVQTIEQASTAIAKKFGVEIASMPNITRYPPEFGRAMQLEHLGDVLKSLALGSKAAKVGDFEKEPPAVSTSVETSEAPIGEGEQIEPGTQADGSPSEPVKRTAANKPKSKKS